jgi:hypothetical protein
MDMFGESRQGANGPPYRIPPTCIDRSENP